MKTQGVDVVSGYLVLDIVQGAIPVQFWNRVKHALQRAMLLDEFRAEYRLERHMVLSGRENPWDRGGEWDREEQLFRRWVERLFGEQTLWPWQRGWTEQLVDEYLQAPLRAGRAA